MYSMSPCPPPRPLRVNVPKHSSQRLGPALTNEVRNIAKQRNLRVQLHPPVEEQSGGLSSSMESASEWNSLLTTARAERGPQWDVATQQFLVEKDSHLYYDPTLLLQAARTAGATESEGAGPSKSSQQLSEYGASMLSPSTHRQNYPGQQSYSQTYPGRMANSPAGHHPNASHTSNRKDAQYYGNGYSSGMHGGQYYGDMQTPTKGGGIQDGMSPDVRRRVTRAMAGESSGLYG